MKLAALAQTIGARLLGDGDIEVDRVRAVDEAGAHDLAFASAPRELRGAYTTRAGGLLVDEGFAAEHAHELPCTVLASSHAPQALALAIEALHPQPPALRGIHERAVVHESALVHDDAYVGPLAVIGAGAVVHARAQVGPLAYVGDGVVVGLDARIGPGAVLMPGTRIGERAIVGPGSVIGDEGFVFAPSESANVRVRHVAGVRIGDDVDIGANSTIDRGLLRDTRVGRGTVVDNLVQVAHDVIVGEDAVIIAQVGIAGDARVGDGAVLAGQAGVKDHVHVGKRARVAGQAGVTRDVDDGEAVSGMPAIPHMTWLRAMARLSHLDELEKRVRSLEAAVRAAKTEAGR